MPSTTSLRGYNILIWDTLKNRTFSKLPHLGSELSHFFSDRFTCYVQLPTKSTVSRRFRWFNVFVLPDSSCSRAHSHELPVSWSCTMTALQDGWGNHYTVPQNLPKYPIRIFSVCFLLHRHMTRRPPHYLVKAFRRQRYLHRRPFPENFR